MPLLPMPSASTAAAAHGAAPATTAVAVVAVPVIVEVARFQVEPGVVKFYFATGKTDLAPGSAEALADVVKGVAAGQKAVISGYHDSTGDPVANAELAKQRAMKVRDTLVSIGVAEDKVELKKPEQMAGDGPDARRVDVVLM